MWVSEVGTNRWWGPGHAIAGVMATCGQVSMHPQNTCRLRMQWALKALTKVASAQVILVGAGYGLCCERWTDCATAGLESLSTLLQQNTCTR
jgi:hypothetical protein